MTIAPPTSWLELTRSNPDLAADAAAAFRPGAHHVLATLDHLGAPRTHGTEVFFAGGELCLGTMVHSVKTFDLQRDGRCSLHACPTDPHAAEGWAGDIKLHGVAVELHGDEFDAVKAVCGADTPCHLWRIGLLTVVRTRVVDDGTRLQVTWWSVGGTETVTR